jgi:hypothetical protein
LSTSAQKSKLSQEQEAIILRLTGNSNDKEDIDLLSAQYSDDDETIYFEKQDLPELLFKLEDNNLVELS